MIRPSFKEMKPTLLAALKHIREHGPINPDYGICYNVAEQMNKRAVETLSTAGAERIYYSQLRIERGLADYFVRWPKHSVNLEYPVEGSEARYHESIVSGKMWDRKSELRGKLRWELLDFLIEELEKEQYDAEQFPRMD